MNKEALVEVSARHIHLTSEDVEKLFGKGYQLTPVKWLSQPGQFQSAEKVNIHGRKRDFNNVSILGPVRKASQVELSLSDCISLGVDGVLRESGDIDGTPGIEISAGDAKITLEKGVIVAQRHIHMTPKDAADFGVKDKQIVSVKINSERGLVYDNVVVRVSDNFSLAMHVDTDEANAAFVKKDTHGEVIIG